MTRSQFRRAVVDYDAWLKAPGIGSRSYTGPMFWASRVVDGQAVWGKVGTVAAHLEQAQYFLWKVAKGAVLAGNRPDNGQPYSRTNPADVRVSRRAHLAMAAEHLAMARELRLAGRAVG